MCMITYIPRGVDIPTEGIEAGSRSNQDGHGWAVASKSGLLVGKSMNFDQAISELIATRAANPGSAAIFHSRFGTHGEYGLYNVHPFYTGDNAVMAHNGVLPSGFLPLKGDRRSDTRIFVDTLGRPYSETPSGVPSRRAARLLADAIGRNNKLVFLAATDNGPRVRIINSTAGEWDSGVWYSNSYWRQARKVRYYEPAGDWRKDENGVWSYVQTPKVTSAQSVRVPNGYAAPKAIEPADNWAGAYTARGWTSDGKVFSERKPLTPPDAGNGKLEYYGFRESCPRCYSTNILEIAQVCADCRLCLDCERDLDMCICFESAKEWIENQTRTSGEAF